MKIYKLTVLIYLLCLISCSEKNTPIETTTPIKATEVKATEEEAVEFDWNGKTICSITFPLPDGPLFRHGNRGNSDISIPLSNNWKKIIPQFMDLLENGINEILYKTDFEDGTFYKMTKAHVSFWILKGFVEFDMTFIPEELFDKDYSIAQNEKDYLDDDKNRVAISNKMREFWKINSDRAYWDSSSTKLKFKK